MQLEDLQNRRPIEKYVTRIPRALDRECRGEVTRKRIKFNDNLIIDLTCYYFHLRFVNEVTCYRLSRVLGPQNVLNREAYINYANERDRMKYKQS